MTNYEKIKLTFSYFDKDLLDEIIAKGKVLEIKKNNEILRQGQYVKVIPLVIEGLIKVFSIYEDKELLLYYIQPGESCIMSFASGLKNEPSKVVAITEKNTLALLLPVDYVSKWIKQYSNLNALFYMQYNMRYSELLDTINSLLFNKLDKRLYDYLISKSKIVRDKIIHVTHKQIANELGTAREVISRIIKKLEKENKVKQQADGIEIL